MNLHVRFAEPKAKVSLAQKTRADLEHAFPNHFGKISEGLWEGLETVLGKLEQMADGDLKALPYLAKADPGDGKTQTAVHFIRNLLASPAHKDVAVLYCVSRLQEIKSLIRDMGLNGNVGVYTADAELNKLGAADHTQARVLITTQQMVDSRLSHVDSFDKIETFHYRGWPRLVRIWDEAMMPAEELTINVFRLAAMADVFANLSGKLADRILEICAEVRALPNGATYKFFDPVAEFGIDVDQAVPCLKNSPTGIREAGHAMWKLAGKEVKVRLDPFRKGNTMLDYRNHLPDDFFPVVILDASGRVRATYEFWSKGRKNLVPLGIAAKRYTNLKVHVWDKGGGKDSWRHNAATLIDGVVATIKTKPEEKWLVVVHKEDNKRRGAIPDLEAAIRDLVPGIDVRFLTWGNAHATNEFIDCTNVVLAGTLFYPPAVYEVRARASMGLLSHQELAEEDYKELELGEHRHLILQAACRGSVRKRVGDECSPMDLYVIARKETGIPAAIRAIFPHCTVQAWCPVDRPLRGHAKNVLEMIREHFKASKEPLPFRTICAKLGLLLQNFNRIRNDNQDFRAGLAKMGVFETSANGSPKITQFELRWMAG